MTNSLCWRITMATSVATSLTDGACEPVPRLSRHTRLSPTSGFTCRTREYSQTNQSVPHSQVHATITNLSPFTEYRASVAAIAAPNIFGVGGGMGEYASPAIVFKTLPAAPGYVENLVVKQVDLNQLLVSWSPPIQKNGEISEYEILMYVIKFPTNLPEERIRNSIFKQIKFPFANISRFELSMEGFQACVSYLIEVEAATASDEDSEQSGGYSYTEIEYTTATEVVQPVSLMSISNYASGKQKLIVPLANTTCYHKFIVDYQQMDVEDAPIQAITAHGLFTTFLGLICRGTILTPRLQTQIPLLFRSPFVTKSRLYPSNIPRPFQIFKRATNLLFTNRWDDRTVCIRIDGDHQKGLVIFQKICLFGRPVSLELGRGPSQANKQTDLGGLRKHEEGHCFFPTDNIILAMDSRPETD
ncbi:unnamed protein product [Protopolystoma xenopodis]|uniref:Fibronectin type-III domain-containing protein n=1 Tax=Protopolystoma xenopodis TaxID=117903 RepID=A0A3S5CMB0_9PLAT|nr:unnamed protein product [Protopolystoma xenopodis]